MSKIILTEKETPEYIGMSRSFLRQDRMNGARANKNSRTNVHQDWSAYSLPQRRPGSLASCIPYPSLCLNQKAVLK
jgi:hypothetical protein